MLKKSKITYEAEEENCQQKIKALKAVLKKAQKERNDYLAGWQRAKADLINSQRRFEAKMQEICDGANFDLVRAMLPVLDSLDAAIKNDGLKSVTQSRDRSPCRSTGQAQPVSTGIENIHQQFLDVLAGFGLEEIRIKKGDKLDHNLCEVVAATNTGDRVSEIIQKGYLLNNKVIRLAKVKSGDKRGGENSEENNE